jgi:hypothetical protein
VVTHAEQLVHVDVSQQLDPDWSAPPVCLVEELWVVALHLVQLREGLKQHLVNLLLGAPLNHVLQDKDPNTA